MGEQRSRRPGKQPAIDLIDTAQSRGLSTAPRARKTRPERHRKSDRRREHKGSRKRSSSKHRQREVPTSPERPANPRVNPIFVWVRQEDSHIVEVKCEDYDKRNRILLTKTAQGWRAIPRTETLVPTLKEADDKARHRKSRKSHRAKRKSTAVQVDEDQVKAASPTWSSPVNVESHLPSHTIHVTRKRSLSPEETHSVSSEVQSVNSAVDASAQEPIQKCSASKMYDVSPLDNLLAVAELEFNQQIRTGEWKESDERPESVVSHTSQKSQEDVKEENKDYIENMEQLNSFIENYSDCHPDNQETIEDFPEMNKSTDECDYNDDDGDNLAMDDILSRLEQSLRSPDVLSADLTNIVEEVCEESHENPTVESKETEKPPAKPTETIQELPTDLSMSKKDETDQPTDLSMPKTKIMSPPRPLSPRPPSHSSETIQSPQPSGIPAIPPSPDTFNNNTIKSKTGYLETLLTTTQKPNELEITTSHKEPLDLGKNRESASPTVTCSEEIKSNEPLTKKLKMEDATLKKLLVSEKPEKPDGTETPKLLELLRPEADPTTQLKHILSNSNLNVPDPMLVPKDRLSSILSSPGKEIPKLLKERPELRLPEALSFPHLLQDPDILVITLSQLQTIIEKQSQPLPLNEVCAKSNETTEKVVEVPKTKGKPPEKSEGERSGKVGKINGLASDIDAATNAAFNQMMWLPYLNQLELATLGLGSNPDFFKMLSSVLPTYPGQLPDINPMFNRFQHAPTQALVPPSPYSSPMEVSLWQEAMAQASLAKNKNPYDFHNKNTYRDYIEKLNTGNSGLKKTNHPQKPPSKSSYYPPVSNPYLTSNTYQQNNLRHNLQIPQYNPILQRNLMEMNKMNFLNSNSKQPENKPKHHQNENRKYGAQQSKKQSENNSSSAASKHKVMCKPLSNLTYPQEPVVKKVPETTRPSGGSGGGGSGAGGGGVQPIDLSGSTALGNKLKVKQHLIDPQNGPVFLKHDDVPEVGSTTASIEEMQDAQKHLWHPLFGK